ncbi:MAG: radical SAM/SPASM domain-containing protein [Clostridia bacterium]
MLDCYSPLKIFHHQARLQPMREGLRPRPLHVHFVTTNRCNQNCSFCAYRMGGSPAAEDFHAGNEIPFDKVLEILDSCVRLDVRAIELTGGGEPTMHPRFPDICAEILRRGMSYCVLTNGMKWSDAIWEALSKAAWVRFSIDASNEAMYESIRRVAGDTLGLVRSHIRELTSSRYGRDPVVGVGFVVTENNWWGVLKAAENAREDGADNIRISAVLQDKGVEYFAAFHDEASELCRLAKQLETPTFRVFNRFGDRMTDLTQMSPSERFCGYQHLVPYIGADLNVYRCCIVSYNPIGLLGSIRDRDFETMWNSEEVGELLAYFDARQCPYCMYTERNRAIAYAICDNPAHVDFL